MSVKLIFFAQCSEWMGCREMDVEFSGNPSVADLVKGRPELAPILKHRGIIKVVVNEEFADYGTVLKDGDEVAFLPPVSGG